MTTVKIDCFCMHVKLIVPFSSTESTKSLHFFLQLPKTASKKKEIL